MKRITPKSCTTIIRDPDVVKFRGQYYLCYAATHGSQSGICISCADSVDNFDLSYCNFVYTADHGKPWSCELWAPELHFIDGSWYIYVACDDGNNANHRMYVLANHSENPLDPYTMEGKITDPTDKWAIDGNILHYNDKMYFIWSGWEDDENIAQNIYIAKMKNPCELSSERVLISKPEQSWEKIGGTGTIDGLPFVNEGPFAFHANGGIYIAYSASGSWCESYCIALLKLVGDDPLNPKHWKKSSQPILCENELVKGAGHCSILAEEDGTLLVFFHAWEKMEQTVQWNTVGTFCGTLMITNEDATII